jgi:hypothetical protein
MEMELRFAVHVVVGGAHSSAPFPRIPRIMKAPPGSRLNFPCVKASMIWYGVANS